MMMLMINVINNPFQNHKRRVRTATCGCAGARALRNAAQLAGGSRRPWRFVVGLRQDNWIDLGECKWRDEPRSLKALAAELERKVPLYPNEGGARIGRRLFVRHPRRKQESPPGVRVHTLADLYKLAPPPAH